jgi:hypothetical protein
MLGIRAQHSAASLERQPGAFIAQTKPLLCAQSARIAAPACATGARAVSLNCRNT